MRNKTFLKRLNSEENKNGEQTYDVLNSYINEQEKSLGKSSKFRIIKQLFFKQEEPVQEFIMKNMDNILKKTNPGDLLRIFATLAMSDITKDYMRDNLQLILEKTLSTKCARTLVYDMPDVFRTIGELYKPDFEIESRRKFINENIDTILNTIDKTNIFDHIHNLTGISNSVNTKINKFIEDYEEFIIEDIIKKMKQDVIVTKDLPEVVDENKKVVSDMIKKYMQSEHVRWIDVKKIPKSGRHKDIYIIGTKVLRIGGIRAKKEIPFSARVLKPVESKQLMHRGLPYGTIEVTEQVDRFERSDLEGHGIYDCHGEEIYQLYKELRNANIVWIDAPHSLGFRRGKEKNLQNMIILDTDSLYNSEDTENLKKRQWSKYSEQFEERWKREREEKLAKLHGFEKPAEHLK